VGLPSHVKWVRLYVGDETYECSAPHPEAPFVEAAGWKCRCGSDRVRGGKPQRGHDEYISDAACAECRAPAGRLVAKVETLFGIEEDIAVLNGRCRVYR
jgi:hypothetical protein